jgi:Na+-transporting methylmalonyl-CoA/oxaloacetate decarboxylase gamma subunit
MRIYIFQKLNVSRTVAGMSLVLPVLILLFLVILATCQTSDW